MHITPQIKNIFIRLFPGIIILIIMLSFHSRLFFPSLSLYITPDHGRSDTWHLSVANKFYYSQQLKENKIPIWNPHIGMGYPTLAEGQTAIFFLPNLIFFRLLPFVWAYNLTLVFSFILAGWGTYLFSRSLGLNKIAATYSGIIFPLGGFFVFHVQHHNLLQTASITPFLFWATNEFIKTKKSGFLCLFSLFLALQLFAGFPQITAYSLFFVVLYFIIHAWKFKKNKFRYSFFFFISIFAGFLIATVQLLPTAEFLLNSDKITNPKQILEQFPYKIENLKQFINPYILGSPKDGTYLGWVPNLRGIFWENSAYVGVIPLALFAAAVFALFKQKFPNKKMVLISVSFVVLSLTLALGKELPLHPIYAIPPFSFFRVPSRFLLLTQLFIVISSAFLINKISSKKIVSTIILVFATLNLFFVYYTYNPVGNAEKWLKEPDVSIFLKTQKANRIVTLGQFSAWDQTFRKNGWKDLDFYYFSRNSVDANSNIIFGLEQILVYESILSKRSSAINNLINSGIKIKDGEMILQPKLIPLLESLGVDHIITPYKINNEKLSEDFKSLYKENSMQVYKLDGTSPVFTLYDNYSILDLPSQIAFKIADPNFNIKESVILEKDIGIPKNLDKTDSQVQIDTQSPENLIFSTKSSKPFIFVLKQSYFPGWKGYIDSRETEIIPANVNFQAILIPQGNHKISFEYKPNSLYLGTTITLSTLIIMIFFYLKKKPKHYRGFSNLLLSFATSSK